MDSDRTRTTRRQYLQAIGTATLGATALHHAGSTRAQTGSDKLLLDEDFEEYDVGSFPGSWSQSGNSNQQVVSDPVASGEQALQMVGSHGGCWQALAHYELADQIPSDETIVFRGRINPTGDGGGGCHGTNNGAINLQDSPASAGGREYRQNLLLFDAKGTVNGAVDLGSCEVGAYNSFEVEYYWDSSTDEIDLSYSINGENRGSTTIDATTDDSGNVVESELVYFTVTSGDYTLYVDNLEIVRQPAGEDPLRQQGGGSDGADDGGGIPVLTRFTDSDGSLALGLLAILGGVGAYAWHRNGSDNPPRRPGQASGQVPPQQDQQYGSNAGRGQYDGQQQQRQQQPRQRQQQRGQTQRQSPQREQNETQAGSPENEQQRDSSESDRRGDQS